ncbi:MAG: PilX N-terminal domain-containing pilus assembly protein [Thermodesulfobacteriota bacterium]|nr:PilX N-terminal domain-containing pilus assembly protein [Thermodesulfobacteriota bacterium]
MKNNQEGMVLVLVLVVLLAAIVIGITVMRSSTIEARIAGNERAYKRDFYTAESAGNYAVANFDAFASSTIINMNTTYPLSPPVGSMISSATISVQLTRTGTSPVGEGTSATQVTTNYYKIISDINNQNIEIGVWKNFPTQ